MKLSPLLLFFLLSLSVQLFSQDKKAFTIFSSAGTALSYRELLNKASASEVVFFGEQHDNPIAHWLQRSLLTDLRSSVKKELICGAEMFEADDQLALSEYLKAQISEKTFTAETKLWPNYKTDYKPLVEFCKSEKLQFIATNIPRRYANMVYARGLTALDSIDSEAKKFIAPLPFPYDPELKCYKEIFSGAGHGGVNLPLSQAIKDATMAHFISKNTSSGKLFLHFNGAYHTMYNEGICWYLKKYNSTLSQLTIAVVEQKDIEKLSEENKGIADIVICVPDNMTKTH